MSIPVYDVHLICNRILTHRLPEQSLRVLSLQRGLQGGQLVRVGLPRFSRMNPFDSGVVSPGLGLCHG